MEHKQIIELKHEYEKNTYQEIYRFDEDGCSLVMNENDHHVYFRKELTVYNLQVFDYLQKNTNPHIPQIYYCSRNDEGKLIVIEEYISGRTLMELMEEGTISDEEKKRIFREIMEGLKFLHQAQPPVIHRDIKPENIMICPGGRVVIIDFNAAKTVQSSQSRDTVLIGTVGSAAPEQYGFAQSDVRTDIYALGVLIRQLLPEDRRWMKAADKATKIDPEQRFQTVRKMEHALFNAVSLSLPVPGFRTGTPWKMLAAVPGYIAIIALSFSLYYNTARSMIEVWSVRFAMLCTLLLMVDLCTDWTPLFRKIPIRKIKNPGLRIAGYAGGCLVLFLIWMLFVIIAAGVSAGLAQ